MPTKPAGPTNTGIKVLTLAEIRALAAKHPTELPSLPFCGAEGYIIAGWSHLLAGLPKVGKTETLFASVLDWIAEGHSALWISEESEAVWGTRYASCLLEGEAETRLQVAFGLGHPPDELLELAAKSDAEIIVVDTIRNLAGIRDENDNTEIARMLGQWEARLQGKTRVYVHHRRKETGDHGTEVAGGTMMVGSVDRVLVLERDPNDPQRRVLKVYSRIVGAEDLLIGLDESGRPVALGHRSAVELEAVKSRSLAVLEKEAAYGDPYAEGWLTTREIRERLNPRPSDDLVRKALDQLLREGEVERDPAEPRKGATYKWRRVAKFRYVPVRRDGRLILLYEELA